jgi:hypothetical protein
MSAAASAAKCPSPRCSRSTVAACQSAAKPDSGTGSAASAEASTRPEKSSSPVARQSRPAAAPAADSRPASRRPSPSVAPASLTRNASSGVISAQTPGMAREMKAGAKLKKEAVTTAAPAAPSGAARPAK